MRVFVDLHADCTDLHSNIQGSLILQTKQHRMTNVLISRGKLCSCAGQALVQPMVYIFPTVPRLNFGMCKIHPFGKHKVSKRESEA